MGDLEAGLAHGGEHGLGRRRGRGEERTVCGRGRLLGIVGVEQRRHHDRRAAEMRDAVLGDRVDTSPSRAPTAGSTCVPATTEIDHGKHQPLQWNIGSVQR